MKREEALKRMVAPGTRRPGKYREGVIQIWLTRACDKTCYGCTQGSNLRGHTPPITIEQFEQACISLKDYYGVVGIFGGNPCLHSHFEEICKILQKHIPFEQRGLWANKLFGKGAVCRETFNPAVSNLNVHCDKEAFQEFKKDWPGAPVFGVNKDSRHSPPYVAMGDVVRDKEKQWELIANCDINQHWSAMIGVFRGELRAWFCEVAAAQSIIHQNDSEYPDTGISVSEGWWKKPLSDFEHQIDYHCHRCGVPLRIYGELSQAEDGVEKVSATHFAIYKPKKKDRKVELVQITGEKKVASFIDYLGNARR